MERLIDADRLKEVFSINVVGGNAYFDLIDSAPSVEAIPKSEYKNRLKADLEAILVKLQFDINEIPINKDNSEPFRLGQASAYDKCENLIQQKINSLKAESEGT